MTTYVNVVAGQIVSGPKIVEDRADLSGLTPAQRNALGWFALVDQPPTFDPSYQSLAKLGIALINGSPVQQYAVSSTISLATFIAARSTAVDALLEQKLAVGVPVPGTAALIQVRDGDRANLGGATVKAMLATAGSLAWDATQSWRMADNSSIAIATPVAMITVAAAAEAGFSALKKQSFVHKDALAKLTDLASVAAYDITAGW